MAVAWPKLTKDVPVASFRGSHPAVTEMIKAASSPLRWGLFTVRPLMRSALPPARGSRRMVVAHVACNADALVNLMTWARAGRKAPMYATREASIAETAARPAGAE